MFLAEKTARERSSWGRQPGMLQKPGERPADQSTGGRVVRKEVSLEALWLCS